MSYDKVDDQVSGITMWGKLTEWFEALGYERVFSIAALIFLFSLAGCNNHVIFEPRDLPDGYIGQEYYVPIAISGGAGPVVDFNYDIHPANSGLKLVFSERKYYTKYIYNNFTIQGKPKSQGTITININGGLVASAGQYFEKKYEVNVLN